MLRSATNLLTYLKGPPCHTVSEPPKNGEVSVQQLDFVALGLPEYQHKFALVIDNLLTPEDCTNLLNVTGASFSEEHWEVAQINGGRRQYTDTSYRNSGRIMVNDQQVADKILEKIRPYLGEIEILQDSYMHDLCAPTSRAKTTSAKSRAQLLRLNERLRFLRYGSGEFFKRHCDSLYFTPDRTQASYYTLQVYLNGDAASLKGGSTRFYSRKDAFERLRLRGPCVDVPSRTGRVLVFEQKGLIHSGEPVVKGVKVSVRTEFMYEVVTED